MNANLLRLSFTLLKRQWHTNDVRLLWLSLFLSCFMVASIHGISERLQGMLIGQSGQFLAADRAITSPQAMAADVLALSAPYALETAHFVVFQSMLFATDTPHIVTVKAVSAGYPLRGQVQILNAHGEKIYASASSLAAGQVWLDQHLFTQLHLKVGDTVEIGDAQFTISAPLVSEPDAAGSVFSMGAKVIIAVQDAAKTGALSLASKQTYHYLFKGENAQLLAFESAILPKLTDAQRWLTIENSQPAVAKNLQTAKQYFQLAAGIVVILASLALFIASIYFRQRQMSSVALFKALGLTSQQVQRVYLYSLLWLWLSACVVACLLSLLLQQQVLAFAAKQLLQSPPSLAAYSFFIAVFSTFCGSAVIIFLPLRQLKKASVLMLFRQAQTQHVALAKGYLAGFVAVLWLMLWLFTANIVLSLVLIIGLLLLIFSLAVLFERLLRLSVFQTVDLQRPLAFALYQLHHHRQFHALQLAMISVSLTLLLCSSTLQSSLMQQWQKQVPEHAPNLFVANIYENNLADIEQFLAQAQKEVDYYYPIVRGRLTAINDAPLNTLFTGEYLKKSGVDRELNLSYREHLPKDNAIVTGQWFAGDKAGISIEQKLAERLHIQLGDELSFLIDAQPISAQVQSIRTVDWNTMQPNFFLLFDEKTLAHFARTYLASFHLPAQQEALLTQLMRNWPGLLLIDIRQVLGQVQQIMQQVSQALRWIAVFILFAALLVFAASLLHSFAAREQEAIILRALGMQKKQLKRSLFYEFFVLGGLAGIMALLFTQAILFVLQWGVFTLPLSVIAPIYLLLPFAWALIFALIAFYSHQRVLTTSPVKLLRGA